MQFDKKGVAALIDQTLLKPDVTGSEVIQFCMEARTYGFASICVSPIFVRTVKEMLTGTGLKVTTVIGFPLGTSSTEEKIDEAVEAVKDGADELDIVMNQGCAKAGEWDALQKEISDIIAATPDVIHKVIIEACNLTDDEKKRATAAVMDAGAEFVKTSTGFASGGATVADVELIHSVIEGRVGIKAAGGIKTLEDVIVLVEAGATRIGTSSGVEIVKEVGGVVWGVLG